MKTHFYPGLFWLAVATSVLAFILIGSGGTVTSTGVGMVDHTWTFSPFNLFTIRGFEKAIESVGWFIEHSHRQLGYIVGMLALMLAGYCFVVEHGWRRWIGVGVLVAVGLQGILGAARILLFPQAGVIDASLGRDFAMVHGFFGQVTFAFLVGCTLSLSSGWARRPQTITKNAEEFQTLAKLLTILFLVQLTIAVLVRHYGGGLLIIAHASVAGLILLMVSVVIAKARRLGSSIVLWPVYALGIEVVMMIVLGTAAWWLGGGSGALDDNAPDLQRMHRMTLATLHQWLGALTLATSLVVAMRARHHLTPSVTGGTA